MYTVTPQALFTSSFADRHDQVTTDACSSVPVHHIPSSNHPPVACFFISPFCLDSSKWLGQVYTQAEEGRIRGHFGRLFRARIASCLHRREPGQTVCRVIQPACTKAHLTRRLTNGASVRLRGTLTDSPGARQAKELKVAEAEVLGECDPEVRRCICDKPTHALMVCRRTRCKNKL